MTTCQQNGHLPVINPFSGLTIGHVRESDTTDVERIAQGLEAASEAMAALTRRERADILETAAVRIASASEDYAETISAECGKPIRQARREVSRCINTLRLSAHAALSLHGETVPFDVYPSGRERTGFYTREPIGPVLAITPFNDPLNLVAHKLGPAIASGNAVVLKPAERTPMSAERLLADLQSAGLPEHGVTILHGGAEIVRRALALPFRMVTFTGGSAAAEAIIAAGGIKRYAMDLGGNAAVIVMADCNLDLAVNACVDGAFSAAGQNCIGVQRILVEASIAGEFERAFVERAQTLVVGNPLDDSTDVGPMIDAIAASRAEFWISDAIAQGAIMLCGGQREQALLWPTVLKNVARKSLVWSQEAFAPVVSITAFESFDHAVEFANDGDVSLHVGIFTGSLERALEGAKRLQASGVMINETSDYRFDGMPFGGFKKGSMGREGVQFAIEEMTQTKTICFSR